MKILAAVLGLGILLAGCSSNIEDTKPVEDNSSSSAVTVSNDTPETKTSVTEDREKYHELLSNPVTGLTGAMELFSDLSTKASNDPSLLTDTDWKQKMAFALASMGEYIGQIQAINPPDSLSDIHDILLQAMDEYQFTVDNFATALDTMDSDLINECTAHMQKGNELMGEATDKMTALN